MELIKTVAEMAALGHGWRAANKKVGIVPTMGYLHEGHLELAKTSVANNEITVMTIFVNPIQFGPNEDLDCYPRDLAGDLAKAESVGVDYVFAPQPADMYPKTYSCSIDITGVSETLCGQSRPGHFQGVCAVITKLFNLVQPTNAYFGQKDGQQLAVIKHLAADFNMPVKINGVPIVREADGLAKSSRNVYLDEECRKQALVLSQSLQVAKRLYDEGQRDASMIKAAVRAHIETAPLAEIEYVEIVDALTMQPVGKLEDEVMLALAVRFKTTRLIDNILLGGEA
ncbi:MAG: pantoate--beta-alanine ligase [Firmicutes bacterium]|nr:pantoate--beta-alanine ligase [Bacillota bacterium]